MTPVIDAPIGMRIAMFETFWPSASAMGVPGRAGRLAPATVPMYGGLLTPTV
jgi:hypothetical protein